MNVSVVIPALNEEEPIAGVVRECLVTKIPNEIIVVDNGSSDRTADRAREAGAWVVGEPRHQAPILFAHFFAVRQASGVLGGFAGLHQL